MRLFIYTLETIAGVGPFYTLLSWGSTRSGVAALHECVWLHQKLPAAWERPVWRSRQRLASWALLILAFLLGMDIIVLLCIWFNPPDWWGWLSFHCLFAIPTLCLNVQIYLLNVRILYILLVQVLNQIGILQVFSPSLSCPLFFLTGSFVVHTFCVLFKNLYLFQGHSHFHYAFFSSRFVFSTLTFRSVNNFELILLWGKGSCFIPWPVTVHWPSTVCERTGLFPLWERIDHGRGAQILCHVPLVVASVFLTVGLVCVVSTEIS